MQWMDMSKKLPQRRPGMRMNEADYENLAKFRRTLRHFMSFSEQDARDAGLTPQQHQAILTIRGFGAGQGVTIGDLAGNLLLKHQTAVGLVDRLVDAKLVKRVQDEEDRRRVFIKLTPKAEEALQGLSAIHLTELRREAPHLIEILKAL
jgi:DNA-binding MarR family transcriptional regulator